MADERQHRGPHPEDRRLFAAGELPRLHAATHDLCWLLSRGYPRASGLRLVGDRYQLAARQRTSVSRCACSDDQRDERRARECAPGEAGGSVLHVDGFNVLTTVEAALSGGIVLLAHDGCFRDMASMHGSYRRVEETGEAIAHALQFAISLGIRSIRWLLDQPVSNSGRLRTQILDEAEDHDIVCEVALVPDPDPLLAAENGSLVATADSAILDRCGPWLNLARHIVEKRINDAWVVRLPK